tara:strand:+ start:2983 stop:4020 length:1038 start_codon:yes stop_codon:yes gene_type:complete
MEKKLMSNSLVLSEALSIPERINFFASNDKNNYKEIAKLISDKKIDYIVTVARGTSDCAALYASYMFAKYLGLPTYSMPPSIITIEKSKFEFSRALVIIISQSGMSEDLIECENMSKKMGATTLLISNNDNSPIGNNANFFYNINAGSEISVAATKSFVLTLMIILKMIFITLGQNNINKHIELVGEKLINESHNQWDPNIINQSINVGYIISRGVGFAISNEISLKFKELCQEMIEPFSSAEVMHGPKSLIENSFKLFTMSLRDKSGSIVKNDSNELINLTNYHYDISFSQNNIIALPYDSYEFYEMDPIIVLTKFYPWIVRYSILKGLDPDNPRYLTKVTKTY